MLNIMLASVNNLDVEKVNICSGTTLKAFQVIGYIIYIIKILVPIIIIVLGMTDFGKAALSGDDKANVTTITTLGRRLIIGVLIFFIPTIIDFFLGLVDGTKESASKYGPCTKCMLEPFSDTCKPQNLND